MKISQEKFFDLYKYYINNAINIFKEVNLDQKEKLNLLNNTMGILSLFKLSDPKNIEPIADEVKTLCLNLTKRADQCNAILNCTELYFTISNQKKAKECIYKARRIASFAMINPDNLTLFVSILNKYIHFIEAAEGDEYFFDKEEIDDIIDIIKNYISTIKNENENQAFLPENEKFFQDTVDVIAKRGKLGKKAIYGEIII